jgi:hypothetical protein
MSVTGGTQAAPDKTADFVLLAIRMAFALAVIGGTTALVAQYDQRAAYALAAIILLGVFVYQKNAADALNNFLDALGLPNTSLAKGVHNAG